MRPLLFIANVLCQRIAQSSRHSCGGSYHLHHRHAFLLFPNTRISLLSRSYSCQAHGFDTSCVNGTRTGYSIVNTLTVPPTLAPIIQSSSHRELRDNAITLPCALHLFFQDQYQSMSAARKAVRRGEIIMRTAHGLRECNTSDLVTGGEILMVQRRLQPGLFTQQASPFQLPIVYEDDHIGVVVKPPGVLSTKNHGQDGRMAVKSGLAYCLTPTRDTTDPLRRPVPAHRLDSATGGLLIATKTRSATVAVSRMFAERTVRKRYVAIVCGRLRGPSGAHVGRIDVPLGGQEAVTDYEVMETVRSLKYGWVTLVSLRPHTGRTHQLRRHMQMMGHAMVGDPRYSSEAVNSNRDPDEGLMLWAAELSFPHPAHGRPLHLQSAPPPRFRAFLDGEARRWRAHFDPSAAGAGSPAGGTDEPRRGEGETGGENAFGGGAAAGKGPAAEGADVVGAF